MGQLLEWYGIVKRQRSRGNRIQERAEECIKAQGVSAGCVCLSPGSAVTMALGLLPWEVTAGSAGLRVQILLGSGALLLSLSYPPFYEVKSNMKTNSHVTEGSLALHDADLEGSTHCSFPIHVL